MKIKLSLALSAILVASSAFAVNEPGALVFSEPETLSNGGAIVPDTSAFKTKLVRLGNGLLISTYGQGNGPEVYDLKGDNIRQARDIFVRSCMPTDLNAQCAHQSDWSPAINVSNGANLSSISTKWEQNEFGEITGEVTPFAGDAGKPNIFNAGKFATISWVSKYCPSMVEGGESEQRMVSYNERGGITLPFSCVWVSHIDYANANPRWKTQQLTSGIRDAMQDVNKGASVLRQTDDFIIGKWAVSWQEDPHGLQIGGADGPGDGASGANVTHGTDIWYAYSYHINNGFKNPPVRVTNNYIQDAKSGNTSPVFSHDGLTELEVLESGNTGSSRANMMLVADDTYDNQPQVIVTYEETKGAERLDSGKFVRYHTFQYNIPPASAGQYLNGEPGDIISDPAENSRRVRFVTQVKPSPDGAMRMGIFWRQGNAVEGGPGDIMVRHGFKDVTNPDSTGFRPADMVPAVDPNAAAIDYAASTLVNNTPAYNISSNTVPWAPVSVPDAAPTNTLTDTTDLNPYEDARAHRAAIRGNDFYIGYTYARDWAVATFTDQDNYNFWFRRYDSNTTSWTEASNVSKIDRSLKIHVKEPRLVGMPGSMPNCATVPENCQNKDAVLLGWGTQTNTYAHIGGSDEGDIVYTISKDKGATYLPLATVPNYAPPVLQPDGTYYYPMNRFESQLRSTPAGNIVYSVWNENQNDTDSSSAQLSVSDNRAP